MYSGFSGAGNTIIRQWNFRGNTDTQTAANAAGYNATYGGSKSAGRRQRIAGVNISLRKRGNDNGRHNF